MESSVINGSEGLSQTVNRLVEWKIPQRSKFKADTLTVRYCGLHQNSLELLQHIAVLMLH